MNKISEINPSNEQSIIIGVVHPRGSAGIGTKTAGMWKLLFSFHTWRTEDGNLHTDELKLMREMPDGSLRDYMDRIKPYQIISVRTTITGDGTAEFMELLDETVDTDKELTLTAIELQQNDTFEHEFFGSLVLNRRLDWYETTAVWLGKQVRLYVAGVEPLELQGALQTAMSLWENQSSWNQRIMDYVIQELLEIKNDFWLGEDESPVSPDEFRARISLSEVTVYSGGSFQFSHQDDDLFSGHSIWVTGDLQNGPTRADI